MHHRGRRATVLAMAAAMIGAMLVAVPAPAQAAAVTQFSLKTSTSVPDITPIGITAAPDGSIWFANNANGLGRISPLGALKFFSVPANSQGQLGVPQALTTMSDGSVWLADASVTVPRLGRVNTSTGAITFYEMAAVAGGAITDLVEGPDRRLWFAASTAGVVGRFDPATGQVTTFPIPIAASAYGITKGPDNALWFTDHLNGVVGRIDTAGNVTGYTPPSAATAFPALGSITAGPDGRLWFTEPGASKIGRLDPATGAITEFNVRTANGGPLGITAGPDGNLWFTEGAASNIGRITTSGTVTEYPLPQRFSAPHQIIPGPSGRLWFTEPGRGLIGTLIASSPPSGTPYAAPATGPAAVAAFQDRCPTVGFCQTQVNTGGQTKIGDFELDLPANAIRVTGYALGLEPGTRLNPPLTGQQFESQPVEVPGGLIGTLPGVGPILGMTADALLPFNRLTVTQSLAGPVTLGLTEENLVTAQVPINIQLNNDLLGPRCIIGPVNLSLTPRPLTGVASADPLLGWMPNQVRARDTSAAVPTANNCGPLGIIGILDGLINDTLGLPSAAGNNVFDLPMVLSVGFGTRPTTTTTATASTETLLKQVVQRTAPVKAKMKRITGTTTVKVQGVTTKATIR
jgi:streptogramin lyase